MDNLQQEKNTCNEKYEQALKLLNAGKGMEAKRLLVDVMENMLRIAQTYPLSLVERESIDSGIKQLLKISKDIKLEDNLEESHDDIVVEMREMNESLDFAENRPVKNKLTFEDFIGQDKAKNTLQDAIKVAKIREQSIDHVLIYGSAGLGKTTLARTIADEMSCNFIECNAPTIKNVKFLVKVFKNLKKYDIIFIDEIHRLSKACCEAIYSAIQDKKISFIDKNGDNCVINLPEFTLIGATTHLNDLPKPFRDRFYIQIKMEDYTENEIASIIKKVFDKNMISITDEALNTIAVRSRKVPRIALGFANRIIDKSIIDANYDIDENIVNRFFEDNGIDRFGLNELDNRYLETLFYSFGNIPVGSETLSAALNEDRNIVESVEPYLIYLGFINITKNGRMLTQNGRNYLEGKYENK